MSEKENFEQTVSSTGKYSKSKSENSKEKNPHSLNYVDMIEEYVGYEDWRINENANIGYSIGGLILKNSEKVTANYWLHKVYTPEIAEAHKNADFHIHDLGMLTGYCAGWSLRTLLTEGFNGVPGFVESKAPKHLGSAVAQMVNFFGTLQNEWAGAQAFSSVDTYLAPYIRVDNLAYEDVYQAMQELIYNLNIPTRWGTQTPFTNFTFDWVCPDDLKQQKPMVGGKEMDFTYGELQKEMDMLNKAYIEVMTNGDSKGRPFTFPIPTYNITKDFPWNDHNTDLLFEMTAKYGTPNFQNFVSSDLNPTDIRAMCCRLQMDVRELLKRGNGLFGSAEQTGSIGNVTINCAKLGYLYKGDKKALYENIDRLMELAKQSLELKREKISKYLEMGLYPFTKRYLGTYKNHFSTMGVNGINEMVRNFTNDEEDMTTETGIAFGIEFLEHMRDKMKHFQEETGNMYNLEASPSEGAMYRFAKEDAKRYPDIIQAGYEGAPYYTNSSQLPVNYTDDLFEALKLQEEIQSKYTGGTMMHLYMNERISSGEAAKLLVKKVVDNFSIPYFTITPTFSICPKHGYIAGEYEYCPKCDQELLAKKNRAACAC